MKSYKKLFAAFLSVILACSLFAGCGGGSAAANAPAAAPTAAPAEQTADTPAPPTEKVKIGVLVNDATGTEALAFKAYYEEYCADKFFVEFVYSPQCDTGEAEISAIETFKTQGCKAVLSLASNDRAGQIEACETAQMYYTVVTGQLDAVMGTDGQQVDLYDIYKDYEYYLGAIGPDSDTEFEAGYAMAKDLIDQGCKTFAVWGGATAYFMDLHLMRVVGFVQAMIDASGADFNGAKDKDSVKGAIQGAMGSGGTALTPGTKIGEFEIVGYFDQWDMENFSTNVATMMDKNPDAVLTVDIGTIDLFIAYNAQNGTNIKLATFGSFCDSAKTYFEGDTPSVQYMQGKFPSSIGANLVIALNAVNGTVWRGADGHAMKLAQGYWGAKTAADCVTYIDADNVADPAYTYNILGQHLITSNSSATFEQFAGFVSQSSFDEVSALKA
jgi:hypothetical protein